MHRLHITSQQIRIFEAVARLRSYTHAAEELNLSQPAVSIQIKRLEENNDIKLIEVVSRKIYLTVAGEHMYASCQKILEELKDLNLNIRFQQENVAGELKLAVVTPAKYFIPYILKAFLNLYPDVVPRITVINRRRILDELKQNQYDLSIMGRVPPELKMESTPFFKSDLVVVAPSKHHLSKKSNISIANIAHENFLVREKGSGSRLAMEERFTQDSVKIEPYMELGSTESIKQGVMAGLGLSVLPMHAIRIEAKYGHLEILDVKGFPLKRDWFAAKSQDKVLTPPAAAFLDFLKTTDINKLLAMSDTR
ncbi:MAG: LysR family transcriptional regulator, low CO2-responsive transcriptional regulator [Thiomicrorhabdus sp.]|nr:MAG: LysR family transcriptional regulator, low CO2-responsive transcriptional regulator [Thiomicrorhabdus sp.]